MSLAKILTFLPIVSLVNGDHVFKPKDASVLVVSRDKIEVVNFNEGSRCQVYTNANSVFVKFRSLSQVAPPDDDLLMTTDGYHVSGALHCGIKWVLRVLTVSKLFYFSG